MKPTDTDDYLAMDDRKLLDQCDVHVYKSSGPGGQHRNKVSSAVRLRHRPTGIAAHGDDTRHQHQNKALAISRLRMNIACGVRRKVDASAAELPDFVRTCMSAATRTARGGRLRVGRRDRRFWQVAAFLLDVLEAFEGRMGEATQYLGITTGNLADFLKQDKHLLAATQNIRKHHGHKPLI